MPYRDPLRKREWEQRHRTQRVARHELRRIEAARQSAKPDPPEAGIFWGCFLPSTTNSLPARRVQMLQSPDEVYVAISP
jgi:hypothetical protein